jgi:ankyrin repeat protein
MYFSSKEILNMWPKLSRLQCFNYILNDERVWKELWIRDISSFTVLPKYSYKQYKAVYKQLEAINNVYLRCWYFSTPSYVEPHELMNSAMIEAAANGQVRIVDLMMENGANQSTNSLIRALSGGHVEVVQLLLEKCTDYITLQHDCILYKAVTKGNTEIVRLLLQKMEREGIILDYDKPICNAAHRGHIDIVKLMLEKGCKNYNHVLAWAAHGCHTDVIELMLEKGADNYNDILAEAKRINCRVMIDALELAQKNYSRSE